MMRCKNCKFWELVMQNEKGGPFFGECRRYPPTQKQDGEIYESASGQEYMRISRFEIITPYFSYCGEYKFNGEFSDDPH